MLERYVYDRLCDTHQAHNLLQVIFGSEGALAGVSGIAAVNVHVQGLPIGGAGEDGWGEMELHGLPFHGDVRIGKKTS